MSEPRMGLSMLTGDDLEGALRDLAASVAFPTTTVGAGSDIAATVRERLVATPPHAAAPSGWFGLRSRSIRRGLVLALAALLALAAVAAAIGLGLPGIRIVFDSDGVLPSSAPTSPPARSAGAGAPIGSTLGLGMALPLDEVERLAEIDLALPPDPAIGSPDAAFLDRGRAALVWSARPGLPAGADGIGLLISEFRGSVDDGYYGKVLENGATLERVTVGGERGYWISGAPHFFIYVDADGEPVEDSHRLVGDTLIWTKGDVTFRLESGLGRDAAISLAESLE